MKRTLVALAVILILGVAIAYAQTSGMMGRGMMGDGMMNSDQMREMMQRMMPGMLPPGVKPDELPDPGSVGAKLFIHYCGQCHYPPRPGMHTAAEWSSVADRMFTRMAMMSGMMGVENPSEEEKKFIAAYLLDHSLRFVSPDMLPLPESKGAVLFKTVCSQCHALPDPSSHIAQDWPAVIKRMRGNMQSMGKKPIDEKEEIEILKYLTEMQNVGNTSE